MSFAKKFKWQKIPRSLYLYSLYITLEGRSFLYTWVWEPVRVIKDYWDKLSLGVYRREYGSGVYVDTIVTTGLVPSTTEG